MKNHKYPEDGGLKNPVRPFENTLVKIILEYFKNNRNSD